MRIRGIKFICDRCGFEKFYEIDENGEFKEPCGFHLASLKDVTHLCPNCEHEREKLFENFMRGKNE